MLGALFDDGGTTIPLENTEVPRVAHDEIAVHAATVIQPDGDILIRVDENADTEALETHLADVRNWLAATQRTIRRRFLVLETFAISLLVALPQTYFAIRHAAGDQPVAATLAGLTSVAGVGPLIAEAWMKVQYDNPLYKAFRRVRDSSWYRWTLTALSAGMAFVAGWLSWADDGSSARWAVVLAPFLIVAVAAALVALWVQRKLRKLQARFLGSAPA